MGSPPRMREVCTFRDVHRRCGGITPAYAGSITGRKNNRSYRQDHPRVCGKYHVYAPTFKVFKGSPPRMREVFNFIINIFPHVGITPAYAGSMLFVFYVTACKWDHPRVCGKYYRDPRQKVPLLGSPPRMREVY